ncbi:unnamed protein product [Dicrocoelium dendriticum]|nr:unnamed protein product [Dicrocoelium dendriticum]
MGNSWIVTLALAQLNMFVLSMNLSDERLSPFWVYLRHRLVSGRNKTETGPAMELRLNKIYKIGEERIFKEHGASSASFAGYRVVVVKHELATDQQHMLLIFLAQSTNGNLMAAPMLVSLFARVEYQEFAILLGYPVLHRPKIYQPEANEQVDNKLWAVAVVLAILLAILSIHWMVFYAHHHFCKVAHFPMRIRSSNKEDEKERSSTHIKEREIGNKFGTRSESEPTYKEPHRLKLEGRSVQLHMTSSGSTLGAIGQPKRNQSRATNMSPLNKRSRCDVDVEKTLNQAVIFKRLDE